MFWTFIVLGIVMWLLQGLLNIYQLKKFNKELKNLRQSGRVAIGKARGRFKAGCLLLLCIDDDCKIITGKKLQGVTSFARFKDFNELNGYYLPEITEKDCQNFDKQKRLAQGKKCTTTDARYFQVAENLLYVELGIALGKPKQQICKTIIDYMNQSESKS